MNQKIGKLILLAIYSIVIAGMFFFIGYQTSYKYMEHSASEFVSQTFYANISDIQDHTITVTGMEVNDINFRGKFCFVITEATKITWRYTELSMDDLEIGDSISITFTGEVLAIDPGIIQNVDLIQLLDDEK